jgi:hypothetical protein
MRLLRHTISDMGCYSKFLDEEEYFYAHLGYLSCLSKLVVSMPFCDTSFPELDSTEGKESDYS